MEATHYCQDHNYRQKCARRRYLLSQSVQPSYLDRCHEKDIELDLAVDQPLCKHDPLIGMIMIQLICCKAQKVES